MVSAGISEASSKMSRYTRKYWAMRRMSVVCEHAPMSVPTPTVTPRSSSLRWVARWSPPQPNTALAVGHIDTFTSRSASRSHSSSVRKWQWTSCTLGPSTPLRS